MTARDSCEGLLQAMVRFDTVNSAISGRPAAERPLSDYLESEAKALGLMTRRLPVSGQSCNLLVSHRVEDKLPWLLFESHLDTVNADGMTIDPFGGRVEGGRLYGRGACDTKGTGAAMLWALRRYAAESGSGNNVAILYTVDEEVAKTGARAFVDHHLPTLGWRPRGVIVGEPTQLRPVIAHNGVVRWRIQTKGVAAHSSEPGKGRSAISMMVKVIERIESRYIPSLAAEHPLTGRARCSINIVRGGTQINIIPEHCEIQVDRRVVPGEDALDVLPAVEEMLEGLRREDQWLAVSQSQPDMVDFPLDPIGAAGFSGFVTGVVEGAGLPAVPCGVSFGTDASCFARAGIPAVVLGPGDIAQAHTLDEWVDLEQVRRGADVYYNLMCSLPDGSGQVVRPASGSRMEAGFAHFDFPRG